MGFLITLSLTFLLTAATELTRSQECHGASLMDSRADGLALETGRSLKLGLYAAVAFRACVAEPFHLQVWRRVDRKNSSGDMGDSYILIRTERIRVTPDMTRQKRSVIQIRPLAVQSNDHLALRTEGGPSMKVPVPYADDPNSEVVHLAAATAADDYNASTLTLVTKREVAWKRSFQRFVKFCVTPTNCDEIEDVPSVQAPSFRLTPEDCSDQTGSSLCNETSDSLDRQKSTIDDLIEQINRLKTIIDAYLNGTKLSSMCPYDGFVLGPAGTSFCYQLVAERLQLAGAAMRCTEMNSRLVYVQNAREDRFIGQLLDVNRTLDSHQSPSAGDTLKLWTSAIYNNEGDFWAWFNSMYPMEAPWPFGSYTNWRDRVVPRASTVADNCATYVVDRSTGSYYWEKGNCTAEYAFVCKVRKLCL